MGEVARGLTLYMPIAIARMATVFLGTEKLRLQLEDNLGGDDVSAANQLVRVVILGDLGIHGIAEVAESIVTKVRTSKFLEQVFARKMYEVAIRFRLSSPDFEGVRTIFGRDLRSLRRGSTQEEEF